MPKIGNCFLELEQELLSGSYLPGERVIIDQLKRRFNVGNGLIREALFRLVSSGLIEFEENKGFRMTDLTEARVRDLIETFARVEVMALQLAIEKGDDVWEGQIIAGLYQLQKIEMDEKNSSYASWSRLNASFHRTLTAGCQSPYLLSIRDQLFQQFQWTIQLSYQLKGQSLKPNHQEHKILAEAVLKRDAALASTLLWTHLTSSTNEIIENLKRSGVISS